MKIHTDTLTRQDITDAVTLAGCRVESVTEHRSTARGRAYAFILSGHGREGGAYGGLSYAVGSWDDYGITLAELFRRDPSAIVGSLGNPTYNGKADFHAETVYRYETLTPDQAHHAHKRDRRPGNEDSVWVTVAGRHLIRCRGTKDTPCHAYV